MEQLNKRGDSHQSKQNCVPYYNSTAYDVISPIGPAYDVLLTIGPAYDDPILQYPS